MKESSSTAVLPQAYVVLLAIGLFPAASFCVDTAAGDPRIDEQVRILRDELARERVHLAQLRSPAVPRDSGDGGKDGRRGAADPTTTAAARRSEQDIAALEREIERVSRTQSVPATGKRSAPDVTASHAASPVTTPPSWWDVYGRHASITGQRPISADSTAAAKHTRPD